jgi:hypothetical protein
MAIYYCEECDSYKDGDYDLCVKHPTDPTATICEECATELEGESEGDPDIAESMARFKAYIKGKEIIRVQSKRH